MMTERMTEKEGTRSALVVIIATILAIIVVLFAIFKPFLAHGAESEPKVITGSFIVSGYGSGEFAIKGEPEETLNQGVSSVKARIKLFSDQMQLQFVVIGSADTTGNSIGNDELAGKRSEQVKAVLSANFPDAKVVSWSKGDADNVRQVRVEYKIIPTPAPVPAPVPVVPAPVITEKPDERKEVVLIIIFVLAASAIVILFTSSLPYLLNLCRKTKSSSTLWLEVNGYKVKVGAKGKFYQSPFISRSGGQITRDTKKGMIDSLKGCLKGTEFEEQKQELIKKGVIVKQ